MENGSTEKNSNKWCHVIAAEHFALCRLTYGRAFIYCLTTVKTALSLSQGDRRKLKT